MSDASRFTTQKDQSFRTFLGELERRFPPDRTVFLGLLARVMSAGIAGSALAPRGREKLGAALAVGTAVPLAYLGLAGRKKAMARIGQTKSGLIEDALIVAAGAAVVEEKAE